MVRVNQIILNMNIGGLFIRMILGYKIVLLRVEVLAAVQTQQFWNIVRLF